MTEDFGYWQQSSNGVYTYSSIPDKFNFQVIEDEEFWDIHELRTGLFSGLCQESFLWIRSMMKLRYKT